MTILNIGSINWDRVLTVPHFPAPGETLMSLTASKGLGGKGVNQSIAIARTGGDVRHLGAIGAGDGAMRETLRGFGLDTGLVAEVAGVETGTAMILVDPSGENLIVLDPGANQRIDEGNVAEAIAACASGDWVLVQNETNILASGVRLARAAGLRVALAAAPFDADAILPVLDQVDLVVLNEVELEQLVAAAGHALPDSVAMLVTFGAKGAEYRAGGEVVFAPAHAVPVVDTTGAGDTVLGAFLAQIDGGATPDAALRYAMAAGAVQVGKPGAAAAIPTVAEVTRFLAGL